MKPTEPTKKRWLKISLFWRTYIYGLLLLLAVVAAAGGTAHIVNNLGKAPSLHGSPEPWARLFARQIDRMKADPKAHRQILQDFSEITNTTVSIHDTDGTKILSAGSLKQPVVSPDYARELHRHDFEPDGSIFTLTVPLREHDVYKGYALVSWEGPPHLWRILAIFAVVILMLSIMPYAFARLISTPLSKIAIAAKHVGDGDLSARTGIVRSDEVGELARNFDRMAERLQRLVNSEKELLANVSHEVRTPLSRIRVALELAEEGHDTDALLTNLSEIGTDVLELERLIDDVLTAARLDLEQSGSNEPGFVLRPQTIYFGELVGNTIARFEERHPDRTINHALPEIDSQITVDPALIRRVIDNLLDNAVKYSEPNTPIDVRLEKSSGAIRLCVCDKGIGVADDDLSQLFDPFFRTDRSRSSKVSGVGLGLTLCRRIVAAHDGTISALARDGGGMIFEIELPAVF